MSKTRQGVKMIGTTIITEETPQIAQILQNAIREIRKLSPQVRVEYIDYDKEYISKADADTLRELVAKDDLGEIEYLSESELKQRTKELFIKLGANENQIRT